MRKIGLSLFIVVFVIACNPKSKENTKNKTYFDIAGFFKQEALRLSTLNPTIIKAVFINGKQEQKNIKIKNWEQEFKSFIDADINKLSWKGSFKEVNLSDLKTYTSKSDKIPVKKIEILFKDQKPVSVKIFIKNTNDLYTSQDSLSYFPNRMYEIKKSQQIKLMDNKAYKITGTFK